MAYTKIHAIKATINKAVAYICNPDKTDEKILIDSFGTGPETASFDFKATLSKTSASDPNLGFHLIQSFAPGEVSYDEAHAIGIELADRLLKNKYSYVIATHIDHDHIHNHIIFCAADNIEHKKYHDCKSSYYHIRQLSDQLCSEHNLSVIQPSNKRGMKYNEWAENKNNNSLKSQLKRDIDECIKLSRSYDTFLELISAKGYETKGSETGLDAPKYIAFRPPESKQFIRGSERSLGQEYTKEYIQKRIKEQLENSKKKVPFPKKDTFSSEIKTPEELLKRKPKDPLRGTRKTLIDTTKDDIQGSTGLLRWANIQNLKIAAHAYAVAEDISTIENQIAEKETIAKTARHSLVALEKKMKPAAEILHYAEIYTTNLKYHNAMLRSKDPDRYYREHATEINLFNAAEHVLKSTYNINPNNMNLHHMQDSFSLMEEKKKALSSTYKTAEKEVTELRIQLSNLQKYLSDSNIAPELSHEKEGPTIQTNEHDKDHNKKKTEI